MNKGIALLLPVLVLVLFSGCIFDSDDGESEAKMGSVSGTVKMIVTGEPVANVKVYLIDKNAKINTLTHFNYASVDSATTDSEGRYVIDNIASGNYAVTAVSADTSKVYKISYVPDSVSSGFDMNGDSFTIDFIAEDMGYPGAENDTFTIRLDLWGFNGYTIQSMEVIRWTWWNCRPDFEAIQIYDRPSFPIDMTFSRGYEHANYIYGNAVRFCINFVDRSGVSGMNIFDISFPLSQTPRFSSWTYFNGMGVGISGISPKEIP